MKLLRVVQKGGVLTIPWQIRKQLGLREGDILDIKLLEDGTLMLCPTGRTIEKTGRIDDD